MESTINVKLDMSGLEPIKKACKELSKKVEVGILHDSEEAQIGALQHYGGEGVYSYGKYEGQTVQVPARPFLSSPMERNGADILKDSARLLNNFTVDEVKTVLNRVGDMSKFVVQNEIDSIAAAGGNSPRTIETKGKDSPLIDTGKMRASIGYEVVK